MSSSKINVDEEHLKKMFNMIWRPQNAQNGITGDFVSSRRLIKSLKLADKLPREMDSSEYYIPNSYGTGSIVSANAFLWVKDSFIHNDGHWFAKFSNKVFIIVND